MRLINILFATLIVVCTITVSFGHSIDLFYGYGFTLKHAILSVIAVESLFFMGLLNTIVSRLRNYKPGLPSKFGALIGSGLVGWANVKALWGYGTPGIILGLSTPIVMVTAESILSREIIQSLDKRKNTSKENTSQIDTSTTTRKKITSFFSFFTRKKNTSHQKSTSSPVTSTNATSSTSTNNTGDSTSTTNSTSFSTSTTSKESTSPTSSTIPDTSKTGEDNIGGESTSTGTTSSDGATSTCHGTNTKADGNTTTTTTTNNTAKAEATSSTSTTGENTSTRNTSFSTNGTTTNTSHQKNTSTTNQTGETEITRTTTNAASTRNETTSLPDSTTTTTRKIGGKTTTSTNTKNTSLKLVKPTKEQIKQVALRIYKAEGKLPGRPRLQNEAGCNSNQARTVINEIKEDLGLTS